MTVLPYQRDLAITYAHRWARSRNPAYYNYEKIGGDCTNFASQCLYAGAKVMDYTPILGWYYAGTNNKAPAWTGVSFLHKYLTRQEKRPGPFGYAAEMTQLQPGDIAQLSFLENQFVHTPVIVSVGNPPSMRNILVAAHTYDSDYRPLSTYQTAAVRFVHIAGVYPRYRDR